MTCHIDGYLLFSCNESVSQDTIRWQKFAAEDTQENYFEFTTSAATTDMNTGNMSNRDMPRRTPQRTPQCTP